jgi:hypothetical protein
MTEGQAVEKKRKGMLLFYVSTGLLAFLFVGFYFAWTPLQVWYWERQVLRRDVNAIEATSSSFYEPSVLRAARKLVEFGPAARSALRRLLHSSAPLRRTYMLAALDSPKHDWALPIVIQEIQQPSEYDLYGPIRTVEKLTGRRFTVPAVQGLPRGAMPRPHTPEELKVARRDILLWWKREGKAKYGKAIPNR